MPFTIEDDLLLPKKVEVFQYRGPNPFRIVGMLPRLMQIVFQAKGLHMFEDEIKWDITKDPRKFFIRLRLERGIDNYTTGTIKLKIWGNQPSNPSDVGNLLIEFEGFIRTEFKIGRKPFDILRRVPYPILYPFLYFYFLSFYTRVRRGYIRTWKKGIEALQNEVRAVFNVTQRERFI